MIENGHRLPSKEMLIKIKEILNVRFIDLYPQGIINIILDKDNNEPKDNR